MDKDTEYARLTMQSLMKWFAICVLVGILVGLSVALFLWLLDTVSNVHSQNSWLLFLLPVGGLASGWMYHRWGKNCEAGNVLILEQIQAPSRGVPGRLAPLVLLGTLITHLFGGSAGREGTAVQMGGSIASTLARLLGLTLEDNRLLLMCGMAAGFGAVFGTPLAGAVFAVEVIALKRIGVRAFLPCFLSASVGHWTNILLGVRHASYAIEMDNSLLWDWGILIKILAASVCFAFASGLFVVLMEKTRDIFKRTVSIDWIGPMVGACVFILLVLLHGERDYCGLGVGSPDKTPDEVTIESSFVQGGTEPWSWFWKLLLTVITVGSGFKGGEVTPLFFIGSTLGGFLGWFMGEPVDLFAGLGMVGVFAGATKARWSSTFLAIELFHPFRIGLPGLGFAIVFCAVCCFSAILSGRQGIYSIKHQASFET